MIESQYTPGPWEYVRNIANHESEMRTADGSIVESSIGWRLCKIEVNGPNPDADGQVMAAAPEMHEALACWQDARLESQFTYLSSRTHERWDKRFSEFYPGTKLETVHGLMRLAMALCDMAVLKAEGN